jgi:hypothetical protein
MNGIKILCVSALCAGTFAGPALAGEVNGSTTNPKDDFSNGVSICKFSGLNDDPTGIDPEANGPPGRTQSYGQDVANFGLTPQDFNPGDAGGCNGHTDPYRDPGNPNL